jgi:predicted RNA-binding Zn-ribbon protein involved in translation (DUF1610 family)
VTTFFVFKIRTSCTECGEGIVLDGPRIEVKCDACDSLLSVPADHWRNMFSLRSDVDEFGLTEGKTRGSALTSGERRLLISWGPQRPLCIHCGALLDLSAAPPGTDGEVRCACGGTTPTFPPPPWLAESDPGVMQIFGAPPEGPPGFASFSALAVQAAPRAQTGLSLVSFACPDCGANLKVTPDSPRVLRCSYCKADSFLPDALWHALHPVRKRTPFYVAFR